MAPIQTTEQIAMADNAAKEIGLTPQKKGNRYDITVLNSDSLNEQKDFNIKETPPPVETAGLQGVIESYQDSYTKDLAEKAKQKKTVFTQSKSEIQDFLSQLQGKTALTSQAYSQDGGVDNIEKELNDINQKIRAEQNALTRQLEKIEKNSGGMLSGAVQDEMDRVERDSLKKQADLSVIQMGVQGRYDSAKAIADRAVSAYMEKQDLILKTAMFNYEENKDLFDKAEQREFEALAQNRQNELDKQKADLKEISDMSLLAMQNGASGEVIQQIRNAKTPTEAQAIASNFIAPRIEQERQLDMATKYASLRASQLDAELTQTKIQEANQQLQPQGVAFTENGEQITPTTPPKEPTVAEQQSLVFFSRMKEAVDNLDEVETDIRKLGIVGQTQLSYAPSWAQSEKQQLYTQASRQFTEARLRKDSGASIPDSEFANDRRMYFPQPGDSVEVIEQKRLARNTALSAIRQASGNAYWQLYGESPTNVSRRVQSETNEYNALLKNASPEQLKALGR